jgi:hypothetical protein
MVGKQYSPWGEYWKTKYKSIGIQPAGTRSQLNYTGIRLTICALSMRLHLTYVGFGLTVLINATPQHKPGDVSCQVG